MSRVEFMIGVDFKEYERGFFWTRSDSLEDTTKRTMQQSLSNQW